MPEITQGNIPRYRAVKPHITACDVIKTTPNNHPSHVGYDTETHKHDTKTVDLEKTCWNYMGKKVLDIRLCIYCPGLMLKSLIPYLKNKIFRIFFHFEAYLN